MTDFSDAATAIVRGWALSPWVENLNAELREHVDRSAFRQTLENVGSYAALSFEAWLSFDAKPTPPRLSRAIEIAGKLVRARTNFYVVATRIGMGLPAV